MACKITWTYKALESYLQNMKYLEENWPEKVAIHFNQLLVKKLANLENQPTLGRRTRFHGIYKTLVHKRVLLINAYKPRKKTIELLYFWNTYLNPS